MLKTVFMGTPDFSVPALDVVAEHSEVLAVYTQPDRPMGRGLKKKFSPVKTRALELELPVYQPEKLTQPGEFERLQELAPDLIVVVAYGQIIRRNVLDLPRLGCINVHSSLLPRWRGAAPIQWAILSGDQRTGVTIMRMNEKLDAGEICLQEETLISERETAGSLHDRLAEMGASLLIETLKQVEQGVLPAIPQDEEKVTIASKLKKEMQWLDPSRSAAELDCQIRALYPWPGASFQIPKVGRVKVHSADLDSNALVKYSGKVFEENGKLYFGTANGVLRLETLQLEGKRPVDYINFINGLKGKGIALPLPVLFEGARGRARERGSEGK